VVNSIKKGKSFERQIANFLTYMTESPWKRIPNSGGLASAANRDNITFQGDIYNLQYPNTVIECKHWKELSVSDLYNPVSAFANAIKQAKKESQGKDWILFVKVNNQGIIMVHHLFTTPETDSIIKLIPYKGLLVNEDNLCLKKIQIRKDSKKNKT